MQVVIKQGLDLPPTVQVYIDDTTIFSGAEVNQWRSKHISRFRIDIGKSN